MSSNAFIAQAVIEERLAKSKARALSRGSGVGLDAFTVLTALHKDPRSVSEKEIAGVLLRVWAVLDPKPEDGGEAMLNAIFPGSWRTHPLVQLAGVIGQSMAEATDSRDKLADYTKQGSLIKVWTQSKPGGLAEERPTLPPNLMTPRDEPLIP